MSGPIVRKYGFPNFDKIFGEHKLEHGLEERKGEEAAAPASTVEPPKEETDPKGKKPN